LSEVLKTRGKKKRLFTHRGIADRRKRSGENGPVGKEAGPNRRQEDCASKKREEGGKWGEAGTTLLTYRSLGSELALEKASRRPKGGGDLLAHALVHPNQLRT